MRFGIVLETYREGLTFPGYPRAAAAQAVTVSQYSIEISESEGKMDQPKCKFSFPILLSNRMFYLPGANNVSVMKCSDP